MKFSFSWLCDHLDTTASSAEIAAKLTAIGFEVEDIEDARISLRDITVAQVQSVEPHPQAERLHVCRVFDGKDVLQIVCGAKNVRAQLKTALVHVGGIVPKLGTQLKSAKLRGIESYGMMCSSEELGLEEDGIDGILELPDSATPGTPLADVLGLTDPIFTVSVTPNRGDCFSVRGLARELSAAGIGRLRPLKEVNPFSVPPIKNTESLPPTPFKIIIETPHCPFFYGAVVTGLKNASSPQKMQKRLQIAGQRPVDALVDITNYLMFDRGQPMHAYDLQKISGNIHIRPAKDGETLTLLNGRTCALSPHDMLVADDHKGLTLAGIMGGEDSGCTSETTDVFLESGYFDAISVALSGQNLGITSESRTRFERGVDPEGVPLSLEAGLAFIQAFCGGTIQGMTKAHSPHAAVEMPPTTPPIVSLSLDHLRNLSGDETVTLEEAAQILKALGFQRLQNTPQEQTFQIPSWRHDIFGSADLVEEILRMRGYDKLPLRHLSPQKNRPPRDPFQGIKNILCERGFNEAYTVPFGSAADAQAFRAKEEDQPLEVVKPLNADKAFLMPSLAPALLHVVAFNQNRNCEAGALFEVESVFSQQKGAAHEVKHVCGIRFGKTPKHWAEASRPYDAFDIKADLLALLRFLGIESYQIHSNSLPSYYHPGRAGVIARGREVLATFGELHPTEMKRLDLAAPVVLFELPLPSALLEKGGEKAVKPFLNVPFQPVARDFAFIVSQETPAAHVLEAIRKAEPQIVALHVFDVFEGASLGEGKKSIAVRVIFQPMKQTFTDEDFQTIQQNIIHQVQIKCHGELRA